MIFTDPLCLLSPLRRWRPRPSYLQSLTTQRVIVVSPVQPSKMTPAEAAFDTWQSSIVTLPLTPLRSTAPAVHEAMILSPCSLDPIAHSRKTTCPFTMTDPVPSTVTNGLEI